MVCSSRYLGSPPGFLSMMIFLFSQKESFDFWLVSRTKNASLKCFFKAPDQFLPFFVLLIWETKLTYCNAIGIKGKKSQFYSLLSGNSNVVEITRKFSVHTHHK